MLNTQENTHASLRQTLQNELTKRINENESYSLRAFSRDLNIHASTLSHLLSGKRNFTKNHKERIAENLLIPLDKIEELDQASSYNVTPDNLFEVTNSWYFDAICELLNVKGFIGSVDWVAQKLDIPPYLCQQALKILFEHGFIKETPNGRWSLQDQKLFDVDMENTSEFKKDLQIQILLKAIEAIENTPKPERQNLSLTMSVNKRDIPKAKKMINDFGKDLMDYLQRDGREHDEVYQCTLSLFPLTKEILS